MSIDSLSQLTDPAHAPRVVFKVGSALLVGADGEARRDWLAALVADVVAQARAGDRVLVMSNGGFGGVHQRLLDALHVRAQQSP